MYKTNRSLRARLLRDGEPGEPNAGGGGATPPTGDGLGDAGKAAIEKVRAEAAEHRRAAAAEKAQREAVQAELEAIKGAHQTDQEKAIEAARKEARAEVLSSVNARLIRSVVEATAAGAKFHDPGDAADLLAKRLTEITVSEAGDVDRNKVAELVKELAESKPHLVQSGSPAQQRLPGQGTPPAAPKTGSVTAGADEYRRKKQTAT